jgi:hypothetical protein
MIFLVRIRIRTAPLLGGEDDGVNYTIGRVDVEYLWVRIGRGKGLLGWVGENRKLRNTWSGQIAL